MLLVFRQTSPGSGYAEIQHTEREETMRKFPVCVAIALLLAAAPVSAQVVRQTETVTLGRITAVDLQHGTLALDTGMQFTLAPSLQYTTAPAINQEVQITYSEQGGQRVARIIDLAPRNINKR